MMQMRTAEKIVKFSPEDGKLSRITSLHGVLTGYLYYLYLGPLDSFAKEPGCPIKSWTSIFSQLVKHHGRPYFQIV